MITEEIEVPDCLSNGNSRKSGEKWYLMCRVFIKWNFGLGEYSEETKVVEISLPNARSLEEARADSSALLRLSPVEQRELIRLRGVVGLQIGVCTDCVRIETPLKLIKRSKDETFSVQS